jgi:tetrahydromethanopterin S-methyltransferase subunit G
MTMTSDRGDARLSLRGVRAKLPTFPVLVLIASVGATAFAAESVYSSPKPEWKPLFNGRDMSGWDKFLASPNGSDPIVPNRDPKNVFTVTNLNGEPVIHVSGEIYGAITTREEFTNFHARLEFKWGEKRWPPRATVGRDSGILYCCVGKPNPGTGWMTSVENNIMERGVGQWWSVNGAIIDVEGEWITPEMEPRIPYKKEGEGEKNIVYRKGAPRITTAPANGITPNFEAEKPSGEWNSVEVVFWGGCCVHLLNGKVNLVAVNPRYEESGRWLPLSHGKLQLQSEAAEVFYRKVEARPLYELPAEFLDEIPSPVADEQGFIQLLTTETVRSWKQCGPGKFTVENGVASGDGGMGLWWYSGRAFTNFVLRGEFLQEQEIADSGVFVRFPDPGNDPWDAVKRGHEMEIGDPSPENPTWRTGSIYPFHASVVANTKPPGQWNQYEIVCRGHDYSVRINGKLVNTWTDTTKRSLSGFIGLQNYPDRKTVRHRNLRVKELL